MGMWMATGSLCLFVCYVLKNNNVLCLSVCCVSGTLSCYLGEYVELTHTLFLFLSLSFSFHLSFLAVCLSARPSLHLVYFLCFLPLILSSSLSPSLPLPLSLSLSLPPPPLSLSLSLSLSLPLPLPLPPPSSLSLSFPSLSFQFNFLSITHHWTPTPLYWIPLYACMHP